MTGFARVRKDLDGAELVLSVKAFNHRALDMHFHMPLEFDPFENALRTAVKQRVARGHLQIQVRFSSAHRAAPVEVNRSLLDAYLEAYRQAAATHGLSGEPDLNAALRVPGMFEGVEAEPGPETEACLLGALEEALELLNQFRQREGAEIAAEMRARSQVVRESAAAMEDLRSQALPAFQARLSERLAELLANTQLDPQRLAQEAAYLADRSDISEELVRLKVHAGQAEDLLSRGGEIGKKLDFLLQEMHRETNTILSKSAGIGDLGLGITEKALAAKAEIEKIREQALNLE